MNWKTLYVLYNGLLGKSLLLIALSTPVALLITNFDINASAFIISLLGAVIIVIGYVTCINCCPEIIKKYITSQDYLDYLLKIEKQIDINTEFKILDEQSGKVSSHSDPSILSYNFESVEKTESTYKDKSLRILAILKHNHYSKSKTIIRMTLTFILFIGAGLIFYPTITNVLFILKGISNVQQ